MSIARAEMLMGQNRHDLAMRELHGVLAETPEDPSAHVMMAMCICETSEDYDKALEHARAAIRVAPDWPLTHYTHALALHQAEQTKEAEAAIREALRLDPEDADHFALLADILLFRRRWTDALAATEEGLAVDPEHLTCINLRAVALNKLGRKDEADATIGAALARDPENSYSHANMGWTALHASDPKKALHHFREALRIDPNNEWAQAGMLEALKARYLVYRWILAFHFLMARLSQGGQWALLIGFYLLYRLARAIGQNYPEWQPLVIPLVAAYLSFAFLSWFSEPIFNALLLLNPFGRMALPPRQRTAALVWVGMVAVGVGCLLASWGTGLVVLLLLGAYILFMTLPVNVTLAMRRPDDVRKASVYTGLLAVAGAVFVVGYGGLGREEAMIFAPIFLLAWIGFQWYANALIIQRQ